jgi:hypothetical protein
MYLGVFCDLANDFDRVNHFILLSKLQFYDIQGIPAKWIRPSLTANKWRKIHNLVTFKIVSQTGNKTWSS